MKIRNILAIISITSALSVSAFAMEFTQGEHIIITNQYATIFEKYFNEGITKYALQFESGARDTGYTAGMLYKTGGCTEREQYPMCVGATAQLSTNGSIVKVVGFAKDSQGIKFALQFDDRSIDTGYTRDMLTWLY